MYTCHQPRLLWRCATAFVLAIRGISTLQASKLYMPCHVWQQQPCLAEVPPNLFSGSFSGCWRLIAILPATMHTQDDGYAGTLERKRVPNESEELGRAGDPLVPMRVGGNSKGKGRRPLQRVLLHVLLVA